MDGSEVPEGERAEEVDNTGAGVEEEESVEVQDEVCWVFVCCGREMRSNE